MVKKNTSRSEKSLYLEHLTTVGVEAALKRQAPLFWPLGTLEAHGRHLPVGTDTLLATGVAEEMARRFDGLVVPPLSFGQTNLLAQTAPASFYPEPLYQQFIQTTVENLIKHGFRKIILVNGHGGNNEPLKVVARSLIKQYAVALAVIHWWSLSEEPAREIYGATGGHAAVEETAAMLFFHQNLVDEKRYNPKVDDHRTEDCFWYYPPPGEVLNYQGDPRGRPNFSKEKAGKLMDMTFEAIEKRLRRWMGALNRLSGGLRPVPFEG